MSNTPSMENALSVYEKLKPINREFALNVYLVLRGVRTATLLEPHSNTFKDRDSYNEFERVLRERLPALGASVTGDPTTSSAHPRAFVYLNSHPMASRLTQPGFSDTDVGEFLGFLCPGEYQSSGPEVTVNYTAVTRSNQRFSLYTEICNYPLQHDRRRQFERTKDAWESVLPSDIVRIELSFQEYRVSKDMALRVAFRALQNRDPDYIIEVTGVLQKLFEEFGMNTSALHMKQFDTLSEGRKEALMVMLGYLVGTYAVKWDVLNGPMENMEDVDRVGRDLDTMYWGALQFLS